MNNLYKYYRRNPYKFCEDFLGIKLHKYQQIYIDIMFKFNFSYNKYKMERKNGKFLKIK